MSGIAGGRISAGVGANLIGMHSTDRNQEATVYVGNVDPQVTEELLWELFVQAGPVGEPGCIEVQVVGQHPKVPLPMTSLNWRSGAWAGHCWRKSAAAPATHPPELQDVLPVACLTALLFCLFDGCAGRSHYVSPPRTSCPQ